MAPHRRFMNAQNYNHKEKMLTDIEPESKSANKNHFCFIEEKMVKD